MPSRTSAPPDQRWLRVTIVTAFLALSVVMPSRVCSQQPTDSAQRVRPSLDTAALIIQRRTVAVFRSPLGALSPADRAAAAARRIEALGVGEGTDTVSIRPVPEGMLLSVGPKAVLTLTRADVDTLGGATLEETTRRATRQLQAVLVATRRREASHTFSARSRSPSARHSFSSWCCGCCGLDAVWCSGVSPKPKTNCRTSLSLGSRC